MSVPCLIRVFVMTHSYVRYAFNRGRFCIPGPQICLPEPESASKEIRFSGSGRQMSGGKICLLEPQICFLEPEYGQSLRSASRKQCLLVRDSDLRPGGSIFISEPQICFSKAEFGSRMAASRRQILHLRASNLPPGGRICLLEPQMCTDVEFAPQSLTSASQSQNPPPSACAPLNISSRVHIMPNAPPRSLCGWLRKSLTCWRKDTITRLSCVT